jgi:uncharacterized protein
LEIRDPIHGNIGLNDVEAKLIDAREMQRLRYIKQLDMSYLIFPGANHTRFEHSLGTMQVTRDIVSSVYDDSGDEFACVGLVHDIGHGPFSHLSERIIEKYLKKGHEQIGEERIRNSEIKDIISNSSMSFDKIMDYFRDANKVDLVGGALGSDRLDYLLRDSHYTGVAYGIIDYERLRSRLVLHKGKVAVLESGISGAESMLIARYFMHLNVYSHHAKIIASKMLQRAINLALEQSVFDARELSDMYDDQLIGRMLGSKIDKVTEIVRRVTSRRLFKRAYYGKADSDINLEALEKEIISSGFNSDEFILHMVKLGGSTDDIEIVDSDGNYMGKLTELSPLIRTLSGVLTDSRRLIVACDKRNVEKIGTVVKRFLG